MQDRDGAHIVPLITVDVFSSKNTRTCAVSKCVLRYYACLLDTSVDV